MTIALLGCSESRTEGLRVKREKESKEDLKVLQQEQVFFRRQSVDENILDELVEIVIENPEAQQWQFKKS